MKGRYRPSIAQDGDASGVVRKDGGGEGRRLRDAILFELRTRGIRENTWRLLGALSCRLLGSTVADVPVRRLKHYQILFCLLRMPVPVRQRDLAKCLEINPSTLTRLLIELEKLGLTASRYDSNDRRVNLIELSANGQRMAEQALSVIELACERILARVSDEEATTYLRITKGVHTALKDRDAQGLE